MTKNYLWHGSSFHSETIFSRQKNSLGEIRIEQWSDAFPIVSLGPSNPKMFAKIPICPKLEATKGRMRRFRQCNDIGLGSLAAVAICSPILLGACATTSPVSPTITRVVLIWLKHPERSADRAQLVRAAHSLRMIPGVLRVQTGRVVPALPTGVDRSFDLAVVITFRDRAALQHYEKDPRQAEAMGRYLRPLVCRYEVYHLSGR